MKNINWKIIKTAHGNGSHLPEAISLLNSTDEAVREAAYWKIDNYAILQSDLYEAAYYVIDPIINLLQQEYSVNRVYPIMVLTEIALGGNGNETIELQDEKFTEKSIIQACINKLKMYEKDIKNIVVYSDDEKSELDALLDAISLWHMNETKQEWVREKIL